MLDFTSLYQTIQKSPLAPWLQSLPASIEASLAKPHGDLAEWMALLNRLPDLQPSTIDLTSDVIRIGTPEDCSATVRDNIETSLRHLHPWRKGPFSVFGIHIDSEWRSDLKWSRLQPHITPLANRMVLDVGCGNGYYSLRMAGEGASLVIGIDPTLRYVFQFKALRHFLGDIPVHILPLGIESLPERFEYFDTIFSMGVFYHRRSPMDHLRHMRQCLSQGGELVLETLVIEGDDGAVLVPQGRYAMMRNVWFIPSGPTLISWLRRCGFREAMLVDISATLPGEQRSTDWMRYQSLVDFLDPDDHTKTIEGHPAPRRAIFVART